PTSRRRCASCWPTATCPTWTPSSRSSSTRSSSAWRCGTACPSTTRSGGRAPTRYHMQSPSSPRGGSGMPVDEVAHEGVARPLDGVRVLALEQMQALPFATQLLARLGAEVIKVENPAGGDMGRSSLPAMPGPDGRPMGATFLRNNLAKRSVAIGFKHPRGRELVLELAGHVDVVAENFRSGTLDRLGLGWEDVAARHPSVVYLSVSGFGADPSPYDGWPAFASTVEAMSGIYEWSRRGDDPPVV